MRPEPAQRRDGEVPRVERFFDALLERDGAGGSWLSPLLEAAPDGRARLGELAGAPGWLEAPIAVRTETGRRGAFEYPAAPSRALLRWFVDHPDRLEAIEEESTPETVRLRRALLDDDPPGVRARAQDRAQELLRQGASLQRAWWRFEEPHTLDCVLITDRLVVVAHDVPDGEVAPATPWFPERSGLVRDLEAARMFAAGKAWGVIALGSETRAPGAGSLEAEIAAGAPHLDAGERAELAGGYLGVLGYPQAAAATGLAAGWATAPGG